MWPFKNRLVVDDDAAAWHLENFEWLAKTFADGDAFAQSRLALPAPGFFSADGETGHALAERLFAQVKDYCGFADAPIRLQASGEAAAAAPPEPGLMNVVHGRHAVGTFSVAPGERMMEISYAPKLLANPAALIATFAHELAHFLLATRGDAPPAPADEDEHELLTDLAAVYLGFGVFLANSAVSFQQFQDGLLQGWSYSRAGYLPEADLVFAAAIYIRVKAIDPAPARRYLKPHLAKLLGRALAQLDRHQAEIAAIRAADPSLSRPPPERFRPPEDGGARP